MKQRFDLTIGDELPSGIMQIAKVYVAKKRKIQVGDKMAGRHGNKGIVSKIVRQEDMPFLADGTAVDIVLNPLGVPSRMNLGQIYETVLGWAGKELGVQFSSPIFDGASIDDLNEWTKKAGIPAYGKTYLYDGGTGEQFDQPATVGVIYMLKLAHMVEDKMHSRSIGPYCLSRNNRWVARHSSVGNASARWRCGRWRRSARTYPARDPDHQVGRRGGRSKA